MARPLNRLNARSVQLLSTEGKHHDGGGLYLVIDPKGKRWVLRFQLRRRRREMGLGPYPTILLARARELAAEARRLVAEGKDPISARRAVAGVPTFAEMASGLIAVLAPSWRGASTEASWRRSLETQAAKLGPVPVDSIEQDDVLAVVKPFWISRPESGAKLRERIERVLDAAKARGFRTGENPARWRGNLEHRLPPRRKLTKGHHKALPYRDIPAFMATLREAGGMGARALEWTILSAAREGMTTGATWPEIGPDIWTIPGERMKEAQALRVPLTEAMRKVLERVRPQVVQKGEPIFPGAKPGSFMSNATMDAVVKRLGVDVTPHGFRSTFRDWAGDCTDHPKEVAEAALAHSVGSDVERAYRRGDALEKRRLLMEDWGRFCTTPPSDGVRSDPPEHPERSGSGNQS